MIQGYAIPNATILGNNGAYKSEFYKALEGAKAAGATVEEAPCLLARGVEAYNDGLPSTPSLLIVPQFYKAGNLYQDVPPFVAEDSTMRFTVSRNTTATRVDSNGLIASVASGVPRIDWLGQSCPGLLVEASGQNLVPNGVGFNSSTGVQTSSVTDSPAAAISGTLCTKNEASGTIRYVNQTVSNSALSANTTYTVSRFFKYNGVDFTTTLEYNNALQWGGVSWSQGIVLSAASGVTLGTSLSCTGSIDNFGNGWYRVNVRITTGAVISGGSTVTTLSQLPAVLSTGQGFLTACTQLEVGSVATTYIPTTTAAVSRAADVISASGALVSGLIGQTEGTLYLDLSYEQGSSTANRWLELFGSSNYIALAVGINNNIRSIVNGQSDILTGTDTRSRFKIAWGYDSSGVVCFINGTQFTLTNGGAQVITSLDSFRIDMSSAAGQRIFNNRIRAVALYTTRLSNDQLAELTRL